MKVRFLLAAILIFLFSEAQTTFKRQVIMSEELEVVSPRNLADDYQAKLINLEAPSPDGDSYRSFLMRQKTESRKLFPQKEGVQNANKTNNLQPIYLRGTRMYRVINGTLWDAIDGIPNDNALAVSDNGIVLTAINSLVWAYDAALDTTHFENQVISLRGIGGGSPSDNNFDPKLIYDQDADRFILVYLQNNQPNNSRIKVCFSTTNNPADPWNSYTLPGNPLNNNRWTDFPAITITEDELFITVNLIIPDVSWQVGFDGSVIWQVDKAEGFTGASQITNTLWSDIRHNGKFTRNLHPVSGIESNAPEAFFLSNRNFDLSNDTVFVMHLTGNQYDPNTTLEIKSVVTNTNYGVPPNGRQADTDLSDPTKGLQTNDARVLGAVTNGTWIQYVANTVNPATGYSAIYHGFVTDPMGDTKIRGKIVGHASRDYGYPNLAWTGDEASDIETMIGFNFTSPTEFPGVGVIYFGNDSSYSDPVDLKNGENYTDRHSDSYERWGDYFGIQRKFNDPKKVWLAGYFGNANNGNSTWVAEVSSADSTHGAIAPSQPAAFPNPFSDRIVVQFKLNQNQNLKISIFDELGRLVSLLIDQPALAGQNEFIFSTVPLSTGVYYLKIEGTAGFKMTEKIMKVE